ncbi:sulfite exporter TauE/SafE family protein [Namhaeicola litoreus]|uniref:Probable membrane transporter protein n=1 Tax=Namhaeicola litoreus TaxID=1052145 RepID=A0ABW3XYS9_9FLAO
MEERFILFYTLAYLAEVIGTISGFGSSILFVPIASLFFDFEKVLGITALFHIFSNLSKIAFFKKGINKEIVLKLGIPAIVFVTIGAVMSKFVAQKKLELIMSISLFIIAIFLIIYSKKQIKTTTRNLITGGVLSGFFAGLIGTGGAIRGLTLSAFHLEKNIFIASSALIDLGVDSSRTIVYYLNGYMSKTFLITLPFLVAVSIAGTWTGKKILSKISQKVFQNIVLGVVILTSAVYIFNYLK